MAQALIIFVRNPVLGKVKTRLAATMGNEKALAVYKHLLQHTRNITQHLPVTKFVFYADFINHDDVWNGYEKRTQNGKDLGERMHNSFKELFAEGYKKICIIGSDCYELTQEILTEGFKKLNTVENVIGPATDGGYYLLGMQSPLKNLFTNIIWSSESVFTETKNKILESNYSLYVLQTLTDVDEEKDIKFIY
jgi:rSAM/selenodomain-associated transferase 1